jgi:hypothetical protein
MLPSYDHTIIHKEEVVIKITEFDPPKHTYIDFIDLKNNRSFNHYFLSKHCNDCSDNHPVGRKVKTVVKTIEVKKCTPYNDKCETYIEYDYDGYSIKEKIQNGIFVD